MRNDGGLFVGFDESSLNISHVDVFGGGTEEVSATSEPTEPTGLWVSEPEFGVVLTIFTSDVVKGGTSGDISGGWMGLEGLDAGSSALVKMSFGPSILPVVEFDVV